MMMAGGLLSGSAEQKDRNGGGAARARRGRQPLTRYYYIILVIRYSCIRARLLCSLALVGTNWLGRAGRMPSGSTCSPGGRFSVKVIQHAVWLCHLFSLSLRDIERPTSASLGTCWLASRVQAAVAAADGLRSYVRPDRWPLPLAEALDDRQLRSLFTLWLWLWLWLWSYTTSIRAGQPRKRRGI
jgi:hypothetical protein